MTLHDDQEQSIYKDLSTLAAIVAIFVVVVLIMIVLMKTEKYRQRIRKMLYKLKKELLWNTVIRSIDISYLQICMTVAIQINLRMKNSEYQTNLEWQSALSMGALLLLVPILYTIFLTKYSKQITSRVFKNKFESMYEEIHNYRSKLNKYYTVISMLRRILFALIPAVFYRYQYMKVQLLCLLSSAYVIWYAGTRPHIWKRRFRMEIFNEMMIMLFNYHMILFTDFCWDNKMQYMAGGSFQASILVLVFVNASMLVTKSVDSYKRKKYMDNLKRQYVERMTEYREKVHAEKLEIKEKRHEDVRAWKHRRNVRQFIEDKMKVATENNEPITAPAKLEKQLREVYKKKQVIVNSRQVRAQNLGRLKNLNVKTAKQKMFQDQLATIFEESNHSLEDIDAEIKELEAKRDAELESDIDLREMRLIAEQTLENELQEMRKNYIPHSPKSQMKTQKTLIGQLMEEVDEDMLVDVDSQVNQTAQKSAYSEEAFNPQEVEEDVDKAGADDIIPFKE